MSALVISLSLDQGNLILEALAERPFKLVYELIGQLNLQAHTLFLNHPNHAEPSEQDQVQNFQFSKSDLRIICESLGELSFNRVHGLLAHLHQQIQGQLL
jgi:hypothetical protein